MLEPDRWTKAVVLTGPEGLARMTLPDHSRFVVVMRETRPAVLPTNEPGPYTLAIKTNADWPAIIIVVPIEKVPLFENMPPEKTSEIINQVVRATYH